jgi:hypothetical protein
MSDHDPSGRVAAFDAIVELAIEEANDDSDWSLYSGFDRSEVEKQVQHVSTRTIDRALKDAAALGWVTDDRQGWDAGPKAEMYQEASDEPENPV